MNDICIYIVRETIYTIVAFLVFTRFASNIFIEREHCPSKKIKYMMFASIVLIYFNCLAMLNVDCIMQRRMVIVLFLLLCMGYVYLFCEKDLKHNFIATVTYYLTFYFVSKLVYLAVELLPKTMDQVHLIFINLIADIVILMAVDFISRMLLTTYLNYKKYSLDMNEFLRLSLFGFTGFICSVIWENPFIILVAFLCDAAILFSSKDFIKMKIQTVENIILDGINEEQEKEHRENLRTKERECQTLLSNQRKDHQDYIRVIKLEHKRKLEDKEIAIKKCEEILKSLKKERDRYFSAHLVYEFIPKCFRNGKDYAIEKILNTAKHWTQYKISDIGADSEKVIEVKEESIDCAEKKHYSIKTLFDKDMNNDELKKNYREV